MSRILSPAALSFSGHFWFYNFLYFVSNSKCLSTYTYIYVGYIYIFYSKDSFLNCSDREFHVSSPWCANVLFFFSLLSFAIISCWIFLPRCCIRVSSLLKVLYTYSCLFQHVELYLFSYLLCGSCLVHLMVLHLWTFIVLLVFPSSELGAQMWINHGFIKIKLFSVLLHSLYWMHMVNVFEQNTQMDVCIELSFTILTL